LMVLRGGGKDTGREQDRSEENRFSELVHPRLDAGWRLREIFGSLFFSILQEGLFYGLDFAAGILGSAEAWGRFKRLSTIL
jgi:hypothetical protein